MILSLTGAIIASRKIRGGSGLHLALGIVISASLYYLLQFSTVFSTKASLNPMLAVWIPNFIFRRTGDLAVHESAKVKIHISLIFMYRSAIGAVIDCIERLRPANKGLPAGGGC